MLIITFILFFISCILLVISGGWLVKVLMRIAAAFKLSEFVVAFMLMAFSTSLPELFVGIGAALNNKPTLALGMAIGSNIADITIVIGIAALLGRGIRIQNPHIRKDVIVMFFMAAVPIALMIFDKTLSRFDGGLLVAIFFGYLWHLYRERRILTKPFDGNHTRHLILQFLIFSLSIIVLFSSAHFVVKYAIQLAGELFLPPLLIGLLLIALGTSLPELVFESRAILSRKSDLAIGDAMGSVVCNSTLVLGVTALINPITNSFYLFLTSALFLMLVLSLFSIFITTREGLSVSEAIFLIFLYLIYVILEFYFAPYLITSRIPVI